MRISGTSILRVTERMKSTAQISNFKPNVGATPVFTKRAFLIIHQNVKDFVIIMNWN